MPKVTEAHLKARRNQILDAAWACFARKGYHQTTMQDICQESGLSSGAIYRYFPSKEAILKAISERGLESSRALVEQARREAAGPIDAIEVISRVMLAFLKDPDSETFSRLNLEIRPEMLRNPALRKAGRAELRFWRTALASLLQEAKERGQLKPQVDPETLAVLLICIYEGLRIHRLFDREGFKPDGCIKMIRALVAEEVPPNPIDNAKRGRRVGNARIRS